MPIFGKKTLHQLTKKSANASNQEISSNRFSYKFKQQRLAVWSLRILYVLIFIGVFADFIANDRPLYAQYQGASYFPVLHEYAEGWWNAKPHKAFLNKDWATIDYDFVLFPLIPYRAEQTNLYQSNYHPFGPQKVKSLRWRHWLGTDLSGKDIAAGLITGTRYALLVGLVAMSIASILGVLIGCLAGYFGDDRLMTTPARIILNIVGFILGVFWVIHSRAYNWQKAIAEGRFVQELMISGLLFFGMMLFCNGIAFISERIKLSGKSRSFPLDLLIMRLIEVLIAVPGLLLLIALVAIIEERSILYVMLIIGCIGWTGIARFTRAEMLRIRQLEYMEAARAMGVSHFRQMFYHALPNAITPLLITIAFGIASTILLEAGLSFLGLGAAGDEITWGRMLTDARQQGSVKIWWLAVFPGFMIFITVTIFNLIGEGIAEAMRS